MKSREIVCLTWMRAVCGGSQTRPLSVSVTEASCDPFIELNESVGPAHSSVAAMARCVNLRARDID